jgi:hypothetical protein
MKPMYYKRDGTPYPTTKDDPRGTLAWAKDFENQELKKVAFTEIPGKGCVSTVYLGLDHQFGNGKPLIFESMFFGNDGQERQERYSTEAEAIAGHKCMVDKFSN